MSTLARSERRHRLGVVHCTLTGSLVLGILFLLAWATEAVADIPASRAFVAFFAQQALNKPHPPFVIGAVGALVIGALIGGLVAIAFNVLADVMRR